MNLRELGSYFLLFVNLAECSATPARRTAVPTLQNIDYALAVDMDAYAVTEASIDFSDTGNNERVLLHGPFSNGEVIAPVRRLQSAPFDGVLFNAPALATIEVEFRSQDAVCRVNSRAEQQRIAARAVADIQRLQASFRAHDLIARNILSQQERDYQTLTAAVAQSRRDDTMRTVGWVLGVVGGLFAGAAIGYTIFTVHSQP